MDTDDHAFAVHRVYLAATIITRAEGEDDDRIVERLVAEGMSALDAEKLLAFVPSAFAWALLKKMGVRSFPRTFTVFDTQGREISRAVASEHYFTAALAVGYDIVANAYTVQIPKETFRSVVARSAAIAAANKALNQNIDIEGGRVLPPQFFRITAEELDREI